MKKSFSKSSQVLSWLVLGSRLCNLQRSSSPILYFPNVKLVCREPISLLNVAGSNSVQLTPTFPVNGFPGDIGVKDVIQSKKYFKNSCDLWDHLLDGVTNHEVTLCALGGLIDHLSRLMVCSPYLI